MYVYIYIKYIRRFIAEVWGPRWIAKLANRTTITRVYGRRISIYTIYVRTVLKCNELGDPPGKS